jgi:hypothetical protein
MMKNALLGAVAQKPVVPEAKPVQPSTRSVSFRCLLIVLVFGLAACGRTNLDLDTVCYKWPLAEHRTFVIQSRERKPVTIEKIVLNGEYSIDRIDSDSGPQAFKSVTLKTGESASYVVDYSKRLAYADIYSDRGLCRLEFKVEPQ